MSEEKKKFCTLPEILFVLTLLIVGIVGIGTVIYIFSELNDLKHKSYYAQELKKYEQWRNDVTTIVNWNIQQGKMVIVPPTPQPQSPPPKWEPPKEGKK